MAAIPAASIACEAILARTDDLVRVQMAANQAKFSFGDIELTSKLVEGKFPDVRSVPGCRA